MTRDSKKTAADGGVAQVPAYPADSAAAMIFGNPTSPAIVLCGPFVATDCKGRVWGVKQVAIETEGYNIADVTVQLDRDGAWDAELCDDEAFIECVMGELRKAGYQGGSFGRCELGMQGDSCVMLEPGSEFTEFAVSRGFKLLES